MYASTMDISTSLHPKVSPGGFVIIDDHDCIPACRQAVTDHRQTFGITDPLIRVDWSCTYGRKNLTPEDRRTPSSSSTRRGLGSPTGSKQPSNRSTGAGQRMTNRRASKPGRRRPLTTGCAREITSSIIVDAGGEHAAREISEARNVGPSGRYGAPSPSASAKVSLMPPRIPTRKPSVSLSYTPMGTVAPLATSPAVRPVTPTPQSQLRAWALSPKAQVARLSSTWTSRTKVMTGNSTSPQPRLSLGSRST